MKHILNDQTVDRFVDFAINVWHISTKEILGTQAIGMDPKKIKYALAIEGVSRLEKFFESIGLPKTLGEVGIGEENIRTMAEAAVEHGALQNAYVSLNADDVEAILRACL